jgi:hypothetical protein
VPVERCPDGNFYRVGFCPALLTSPTAVNVFNTAAQAVVTTDISSGVLYACVTTNSTPLSVAAVLACSGGAAVIGNSAIVSSKGQKSLQMSGLVAENNYYIQFAHVNSALRASPVVLSAQFTTPLSNDPGSSIITAHENIPNPANGSTQRVVAGCLVTVCDWTDAATWTTSIVPDASTRVIIDGRVEIPSGQTTVAETISVYPNGELTVNGQITTDEILVAEEGAMRGTTGNVIFRDTALVDATQMMRGLIVLGELEITGTVKTPFVRINGPGNTQSLTLASTPTGWQVGDKVLLPESRMCDFWGGESCVSETEEFTINAITGPNVTLSAAPSFTHPCAKARNGTTDEYCPHLINVARSFNFSSANAAGVRAHGMCHDDADCDIQYAAFNNMGRTNINLLGPSNQKGRYPLHMHHMHNPFNLIGNVVDFGSLNDSLDKKWGLVIHSSSDSVATDNVVYRASGAGFVTEAGNEVGNDMSRNFVVKIVGGNGERVHDPDPGDGSKLGRAGVGFWFNGGVGNTIDDNVAADVVDCVYCYGMKIDNTYNAGSATAPAYAVGFTSFDNNEFYATPNGFTAWWVCQLYETPNDSCTVSFDNFKVWHVYRWGYFGYEANQLSINNYVYRGDLTNCTGDFDGCTGMWFGDYMNRRLVINNADIARAKSGIQLPSHRGRTGVTETSTINDGQITSLTIYPPSSVNGSGSLSPIFSLIDGLQFDSLSMTNSIFGGGGTPNETLENSGCVVDEDYFIKATYRPDLPNKLTVSGYNADVYAGCP